ncbi:hypothetical protein P389DRAFT_60877 [Cystobasidium minutum MCA 4210]|uniref:uncharacterized protein n=1 Tax=Cystobasidium minutum MCA 4210 TaxID=1397322 RepID=UPI0034CF88B9|eukprot:jgi/Rhomi1/60877/CE60876_660
MESPSLSSGVLLSPSYGVPPPTGAALGTTPTTMESNEQASAAGEHIQHGESTSHLEAPLNAVSSSSSPLNGNNGSLPAGSSSSTSAQAPAAAAASTATTVAGSAKKKKEGAGGPPKSKAYANPLASRADEIKYRTKYKQLRGKVKEIEEENAKMQAKILKTKRQIQRLRLERSILYDRFQEAKNAGTLEHTSIPVSSLQPQLSSIPYGSSLNGSTSMHHRPPPQHPPHLMHPQDLSPSTAFHPPYHQSLSQGYHPSQFITHPGLMHDGSDTMMMNALHHDMQGVDPTMSMPL